MNVLRLGSSPSPFRIKVSTCVQETLVVKLLGIMALSLPSRVVVPATTVFNDRMFHRYTSYKSTKEKLYN